MWPKILTQPILTFGLVGHLPVRVHGVGPGLDPLPLVRPLDTRFPHFFFLYHFSLKCLCMKKGPRQGRRITQAAERGGSGMEEHSTAALLWNNDRYDAVLVEEHSDKRMISTWQTVDVKRYYDDVLHHTHDDERRCGLVSEPSPCLFWNLKERRKENKEWNQNFEDYINNLKGKEVISTKIISILHRGCHQFYCWDKCFWSHDIIFKYTVILKL